MINRFSVLITFRYFIISETVWLAPRQLFEHTLNMSYCIVLYVRLTRGPQKRDSKICQR